MENNNGREKTQSKLFRILNSTFCFAAAYLFIHYLHWVIVAFIGLRYNFNAFLYYHGVKFLLNGNKWDREMVTLIYGTAPLLSFIIGLLAIFAFSRIKKFKSIVNLFLIWLYIAGVGFTLSQIIISTVGLNMVGSPFYNDWAGVFSWFALPFVVVAALNIPNLIAAIYFGVNASRPFMLMAYSYAKVVKLDRRRKYFAETAIMPFILGSLIVLVVGFPLHQTNFAENFILHGIYLFVIALMLAAGYAALKYLNIQQDDLLRYKTLQELNGFAFMALVVVVIIIKVTWNGIYL